MSAQGLDWEVETRLYRRVAVGFGVGCLLFLAVGMPWVIAFLSGLGALVVGLASRDVKTLADRVGVGRGGDGGGGGGCGGGGGGDG